MNTGSSPSNEKLSPSVVAEAAAWLSMLSEPEPSQSTKAGFRHWLNEHPDHERAFNQVKEIWTQAGRVAISPPTQATHRYAQPGRIAGRQWWKSPWLAAAAVLVCMLPIAAYFYQHYGLWVATDVGEQRDFPLEDGSRAHLNTASRIEVRYTDAERGISLIKGEVFFDVVKNPSRQFVVTLDDKRIVALGTSFYVRRDSDRTAITVAEGSVEVIFDDGREVVNSGERLTLTSHREPKLDRPKMAYISAWRQGQVWFHDTPLAEAVAEMNRYSTNHLIIHEPALEQRPVGGSFPTGDQLGFAETLEKSLSIAYRQEEGRILLYSASTQPRGGS